VISLPVGRRNAPYISDQKKRHGCFLVKIPKSFLRRGGLSISRAFPFFPLYSSVSDKEDLSGNQLWPYGRPRTMKINNAAWPSFRKGELVGFEIFF